jgi:hypothetical protein
LGRTNVNIGKVLSFTVITALLPAMSLIGCASGSDREGPLVEYGQTTVSIGEVPLALSGKRAAPYRACTRADVIDLTVGLMCTHPDGPTDLERQSYLTRQLDELEINPDTYHRVFKANVYEPAFTDEVADGMIAMCPDRLEEMLLAAY